MQCYKFDRIFLCASRLFILTNKIFFCRLYEFTSFSFPCIDVIVSFAGQIPTSLLKDCKALQNISLHGNPISMDQFQQVCLSSLMWCHISILLKAICIYVSNFTINIQMEGFQEFEERRRKKFDKQIVSNVMISSRGLDEGVDL